MRVIDGGPNLVLGGGNTSDIRQSLAFSDDGGWRYFPPIAPPIVIPLSNGSTQSTSVQVCGETLFTFALFLHRSAAASSMAHRRGSSQSTFLERSGSRFRLVSLCFAADGLHPVSNFIKRSHQLSLLVLLRPAGLYRIVFPQRRECALPASDPCETMLNASAIEPLSHVLRHSVATLPPSSCC